MTELICFDGELQSDISKIKVSPFLPSIQFGASVFETFRTYGKTRKIFNLDSHLKRLTKSLNTLYIYRPLSCLDVKIKENIKTMLKELKEENLGKREFFRFKIFVNEDYWWIKCSKEKELEPKFYDGGVNIMDAVQERIFPQAKSGQPVYFYHNKQQKNYPNIYETIFFSPHHNRLTEGNKTNVFIVMNDIIYTSEHNILEGVMREEVLKIAEKKGYKVVIQDLVRSEVESAQEIFLTNTIGGIIPVRRWGKWHNRDFKIANDLRKSLPF